MLLQQGTCPGAGDLEAHVTVRSCKRRGRTPEGEEVMDCVWRGRLLPSWWHRQGCGGYLEGVGSSGWALRFDNLDPLSPTLCFLTTDTTRSADHAPAATPKSCGQTNPSSLSCCGSFDFCHGVGGWGGYLIQKAT